MARAHQIAAYVLAGMHDIARRLLDERRHPDRRQATRHFFTRKVARKVTALMRWRLSR
jgi:hypothetical protein